MRPFLLLATRAEDRAAEEEHAAFLRFGGLRPEELVRVRLEQAALTGHGLGDLDLDRWSGIVVGGSPFTTSDPDQSKSPVQLRVEREVATLLDEVVAADVPFLGACYGIGTLGVHQGAVVDTTYAEPIGAVRVTLTAEGRADPVLGGLPPTFEAFVGHKEAVTKLPGHAVLLARSAACPVQAFRIGRNVYATQFHPELDVPGLHTRLDIYRDAGYFPPESLEELKRAVSGHVVTHPPVLLRRFVARFRRD